MTEARQIELLRAALNNALDQRDAAEARLAAAVAMMRQIQGMVLELPGDSSSAALKPASSGASAPFWRAAAVTDIVERLRAWPSMIEAGYNVPAAATVMHEAAAEIERLRERVATAEALATARRTALIAAEGELAEAVEVVRAFVGWCDDWFPGKSHPSDDFQRARAFLAKLEQTPKVESRSPTTDEALVERVARATADANMEDFEEFRALHEEMALAAIRAMDKKP